MKRDAEGRRRSRHATFTGAVIVAALLSCLAATTAGAASNEAEFYVHTGSGKSLSCAVYDGYANSTTAFCEYISKRTQATATLSLAGPVVLCRTHSLNSDRCKLGNAGENARTYGVGKTITVGRFACTVKSAGVQCTVTATGKGFLLGPKKLRAVGGASVRRR